MNCGGSMAARGKSSGYLCALLSFSLYAALYYNTRSSIPWGANSVAGIRDSNDSYMLKFIPPFQITRLKPIYLMEKVGTTMDQGNKLRGTNVGKVHNSALWCRMWGRKGPIIRYELPVISFDVFGEPGLGHLLQGRELHLGPDM
ncbi:hypothetical protein L1987_23629 [Smallanthus sonchifolius]|uniref:Uncharacterized protein n=1 Tax=Smallanthus sonchifolius TaxID=185202 RepID=A0ACB9IJY5_9ASTR|nr:hypothetical protein L1987_23629 [Smallanthus sonchifolius]